MISKELKNDFREMIFGTFAAAFEDLIYSWEKKHFLRKWAFPEMSGNHFFQENAPQPPKSRSRARHICDCKAWDCLLQCVRLCMPV